MSSEVSVVVGLTFISALFAYYAFELRDSQEVLSQKLAVFMFFMSIVFLNLVMYTIYRLTQEDPNLSFLTSGIMSTGLLVVVWTTTILGFILMGSIFWMSIKTFYDVYKRLSGKAPRD
jgi:hypothetical protein